MLLHENRHAYYRVSTDRQGKSGLGLEAQQEAMRLFADREGYQVTAHYTEVENGRKNQLPQLLGTFADSYKIRHLDNHNRPIC